MKRGYPSNYRKFVLGSNTDRKVIRRFLSKLFSFVFVRVYVCSSSPPRKTRYVSWKNLVITNGSVKNVFSVRLPTEKLHRDKKESRLLLLCFFSERTFCGSSWWNWHYRYRTEYWLTHCSENNYTLWHCITYKDLSNRITIEFLR